MGMSNTQTQTERDELKPRIAALRDERGQASGVVALCNVTLRDWHPKDVAACKRLLAERLEARLARRFG